MERFVPPFSNGLRNVEGIQVFQVVVSGAAVLFAVYHMIQIFVSVHSSSITLYIIHAGGTVLLVCLASISGLVGRHRNSSFYFASRIFIAFLAVAGFIYLGVHAARLEVKWPWISDTDMVLGLLLFFSVTVTTWFSWGPTLSLVGIFGIVYFLFGEYFPGVLGHDGYSLQYAISYLGMSLKTGMFWLIPLSLTVIFPLMVFGMVIRASRAVEFFTEAMKAAKRISHVAPVYTCVIESGMVGMVTGGPSANVALTGCTTIPAMKGIGLKPETAGGLEAIASTGSQLVPPIMGLAAFVMAQFIGVPYVEIMIASLLPAILYYAALMVSAYFVATNELVGTRVKIEDQIEWSKIFRLLPTFIMPLGLVVGLLLFGFSPLYAGTMGTIAVVVLSQLQGMYRPPLKDIAKGLSEGAILGSQVATTLMSVGLLGQALITTGLGIRLGRIVTMSIGDSMLISLVVLMCVAVVIGMSAPTVVAYILTSIAVVPAVQDLGVDLLTAHFFAFYFASFSHVTPPVAAAIVTASRLARSDFLPTAWQAAKLSWPLLFVPFLFTVNPGILDLSKASTQTALVILVYALVTINGITATWNGLPEMRLGLLARGVLAIGTITGFGFILSGESSYLLPTFIASFVGWGVVITRKLALRWKPFGESSAGE